MRTCYSCGETKDYGAFTPGSKGRCRECTRVYNSEYRKKNAERLKANGRRYYEENKERLIAQNRKRHRERREVYAAARKAWWEQNKDRIAGERVANRSVNTYRSWVRRLKKHGLTPEDYDRMLAEQNGGCAICGSADAGRAGGGKSDGGESSFAVDHCHATGIVRGLLCHQCNLALGLLGDDPERAAAASRYLRKTRAA